MTNTFLISEAKIREYTTLDNNVDSALIKNGIRESQDIKLQAVIGTLLYQKLISLVDSGDISTSAFADYKYLLDTYIQDYLLYAAEYYIIDSIFTRSRNNGLIRPNGGENSDVVDRTGYNMRRQAIENKMEYYQDRLRRYLIEEEVLFPELNASNKLYEQYPDYETAYGSPFVFGRKGKNAMAANECGLPVYDSSRKQFPQNYYGYGRKGNLPK